MPIAEIENIDMYLHSTLGVLRIENSRNFDLFGQKKIAKKYDFSGKKGAWESESGGPVTQREATIQFRILFFC